MINSISFETTLCDFLDQYLEERNLIDHHKPECPDVVNIIPQLLNSFMADAVKEFNNYPLATLSWMMYLGMAVSKFWDTEWEVYSKVPDLYLYLRDKRGYDQMDDYICDEILCLSAEKKQSLQKIVMNCASGVNDMIFHSGIENGTRDAFQILVICLKQMYLYGVYLELHNLGYHMTKIN